ncbi:MAG: ABC transporter permease [Eubacterium sp.]|nr:ABC transporter permease [Eubacterium sp.]
MRVKNQKAVRKLSKESLRANRVRNLVAVFAIALTTMMFMSLFTIAGTMQHTFQQETFRQVGGTGHGSFKDLTLEKKEILEKDPMIKEPGGRLFLGIASGESFRKTQAELSYMEPAYAKRCFCQPEQGRLPEEGTKEIACDTRVLSCIGVKPEIGAEVTLTYEIGMTKKTELTDTFLLSGWWEYDSASPTSMAVLPRSYVEEIVNKYPRMEEDESDPTGLWVLDVMLDSSLHIEEDLEQVLKNNGFQSKERGKDSYINIGVNWAYAGAQLAANADSETIIQMAGLLLLIIFTGYLIIYNIFQISVSGDIRFYGLLKTIGTTGKQIRRMIRTQALLLSAAGIPVGLLVGSLAGTVLAPVVLRVLNVSNTDKIMSPWFFLAAAVFSLVTVLVSCAKPGRIAAKVSPVEAVRYTDAAPGGKKQKKKRGRAKGKPLRMAWANLGRNKRKTVLVVASMTMAVVLLQFTYTFAHGFDMDKYLRPWVVSDFILGDASYFKVGELPSVFQLPSVPEEDISRLRQGGQITESGRIYGHRFGISSYVPAEALRQKYSGMYRMPEEEIEQMLEYRETDALGNVSDSVSIYGMEDFPLSQLEVLEGGLSDLYDQDKRAVAAVYEVDDYDEPIEGSNFAKIGDTITIHYVYEMEFIDDETGEPVSMKEILDGYRRGYTMVEKKAKDLTYEVVACVKVKHAMSYRYFENFTFVMNAQVFQADSHTSDIMTYLFNTTQETNASMQAYLEDYTNTANPALDFESKQVYVQNFERFRGTFFFMGSTLSFVIGLVGVLNFFNAVLTSIHSRRREFAMLQSIGMTGKQLKQMLACEGLIYGAVAVFVSLICSFLMAPVLHGAMGSIFWFFTYRFTILPILFVLPVLVLLGILLPLLSYRRASRLTIVERLREGE